MRRRRFLQLSAGAAAATAAGARIAAAQGAAPFLHGVASGDPLPDGVILWTRVTATEEVSVGWEIATDAAFEHVAAAGTVTTGPARDHTVKVDATGLAPATDHWYRFTALGATSPIGRTRTAPAADAAPAELRFGVVSCSNFEAGFFSPYRHLAARDDLDAVLHLGDYIYEYGARGYGDGPSIGRAHDPDVEITTLDHYRRRHATYKGDPDLQALHARYPFVTTIDDHEVANDAHATGAENHQPGEGDYADRKAAALQAYFEWMPIRPTGGAAEPTRVWRRLRFGGLVDLFMLDERSYRSPGAAGLTETLIVTTAEPDDPSRTMLGADQLAFLEEGMRASTTTWRVVGNGVMFSPFIVADLPDTPLDPILGPVLGVVDLGLPAALNGDQWDGFRHEQGIVRDLYAEVGNVAVLTGDIHSSWAAEVPADPATYLLGLDKPAAVEFVTPSVTSSSLRSTLDDLGLAQLGPLLPDIVAAVDPWFRYVDLELHGYGVFQVTAAAVQYDWHYVSDRLDPAATEAFAAGWRSPSGTHRLEPAAMLPARPGSTPTTPAEPATPTTLAAGGATTTGGTLPATGPLAAPLAGAAAALAAVVARRSANVGKDPRP